MGKNELIPKHILALKPYVPGKLISEAMERYGLTHVIKLGSNENNLGPSPLALAAMAKELTNLNRYGDVNSGKLRQALAEKLGLPLEYIICCNGSSEFILILCHSLIEPGDNVIMSKPSFTLYAKNALAAGAQAIEVPLVNYAHDLPTILSKVTPKTKLIFLDSPLNPTGAYIKPDVLWDFVAELPQSTMLVLDEAYVDFVKDAPRPDYKALIETEKVAIMRTFSKLYGLAGIRVAYALAPPFLVDMLNTVRQPFNVNNIALVGAVAALDDVEHIRRTLNMTWEGLSFFQEEFRDLGLLTYPTEANFVMVDTGFMSAENMAGDLLQRGVIVRSLNSFGFKRKIRINAGLPDENRELVKVVASLIQQKIGLF
ncbi:MAG: histidinol-phosphate transaminase [Deltaproteobacteria bacterium]|jgi:histidinol-phosphate aminotransferase|nr:histidinol-phosphate transaminase [Deltaproteobacteria bacterium]